MILRRLAEQLRDQNWAAIFIEFVLLVLGVFLGIQVANWNEARSDEQAFQQAMLRLASEASETLHGTKQFRQSIHAMLKDVRPAIEVLRHCRTGPEAEEIVNVGLNVVRSGRGVSASTLAIDQLLSDPRLLGRQSEPVRQVLLRYHADLHGANETSMRILERPQPDLVLGDLIGFTELGDASASFNQVDLRRAVLAIPLTEACNAHALTTVFYWWERTHVYQLSLADQIEATVTEGMRALDLVVQQPQQAREDS